MLDRREQLALLPLADPDANRLLADVPEERRRACWWIVLRDGTPVAGDAGGAVAVFSELSLLRPLGWLTRVLRLSLVLDALDKVVSKYRTKLGRFVPEGPAPRRHP